MNPLTIEDPAARAATFYQVPVSLVPTRTGARRMADRAYETLRVVQLRPVAGKAIECKTWLPILAGAPGLSGEPVSFEIFGNQDGLTTQFVGSALAITGLCSYLHTGKMLVEYRLDAPDVVNETFRATANTGLEMALADIALGPPSFAMLSPSEGALTALLHALAAVPRGRFGFFQLLFSRCTRATATLLTQLFDQAEGSLAGKRTAQLARTHFKHKSDGESGLFAMAVRLVVLGTARGNAKAITTLKEALRPAFNGVRPLTILSERSWVLAPLQRDRADRRIAITPIGHRDHPDRPSRSPRPPIAITPTGPSRSPDLIPRRGRPPA